MIRYLWILISLGLSQGALAAYSRGELDAERTPEESKVNVIRLQEINELRAALTRRLPMTQQADLYFRLAELYLEGYRAEFILEGRVHEKHISSGNNEATIDRGSSQIYLKYGIQSCEQILKLDMKYEKLDGVYYFLAVHKAELGDVQGSQSVYRDIITKFPKSPYVSESYRELGDAEFSSAHFDKAKQYYLQALTLSRRSDQAARIYHKLAWAYYRTRDPDRAVETLKQAVTKATESGEKFLGLKDEALRDMAVFMAESNRGDEAIQYFSRVAGSPDVLPKLLEGLGQSFERQVQVDKAILVYGLLLRSNPQVDLAYKTQVKLIELDLKRGKTDAALSRAEHLVTPSSRSGAVESAYQSLRGMVRKAATVLHKDLKDATEQERIGLIERAYRLYLGVYLKESDPSHETPEIQMYLADILRLKGQAKEASTLYKLVLDSGNQTYAQEAGSKWLTSLSQAIKAEPAHPNGSLSDLEREFVTASDMMEKALASHSDAATDSRAPLSEVALRAAQVLAGYTDTKGDAKGRCRRITQQYAGLPASVTAGKLWLQILLENHQDSESAETELAKAVEELSKNEPLMAEDKRSGGKLGAAIRNQGARIQVAKIGVLEKNKNYKAAAQSYLDLVGIEKSNGKSLDAAYDGALTNLIRAGDTSGANRIAQEWWVASLKSQHSTKIIDAATLAFIEGQFETAAQLFSLVAESFPDEKVQASALLTSARIWLAKVDPDRGRQQWRTFLKVFPKHPAHDEIELSLATSYDDGSQNKGAQRALKQCFETSGSPIVRAECGTRYADLEFAGGEKNKARTFYEKVSKLKLPKGEHSPFIDYAIYRLAETLESERTFTPLSHKDSVLKKGLDERLAYFQKLEKEFGDSISSGGIWSVAALDRLARVAVGFAQEMEDIPPPPQASQGAIAKFNKTLSGIATPLRQKASDTWAHAYQMATRGEFLSPRIPSMLEQWYKTVKKPNEEKGAMKLRASGLPLWAQGVRGKLRIVGVPADGGREGRERALARVRAALLQNPKNAKTWVDYGNLLWGEDRAMLSRIAYDRASELEPQNSAALNNRAVMLLTGAAQEDWIKTQEAKALFKRSSIRDKKFVASKLNLALLFNYYRLFSKAAPLWQEVVRLVPSVDSWDGMAISELGLSKVELAKGHFKKATESGGDTNRFALVFHESALGLFEGPQGAKHCFTRIDDIPTGTLGGFERQSAENLRKVCQAWKGE